mmetsp:Transcript_15073/g.25129  ORF Transcript_15073/g.25129 Transcript_15073/m.25129 type:complete len:191 (-) Transcript_15073:85-657(-)
MNKSIASATTALAASASGTVASSISSDDETSPNGATTTTTTGSTTATTGSPFSVLFCWFPVAVRAAEALQTFALHPTHALSLLELLDPHHHQYHQYKHHLVNDEYVHHELQEPQQKQSEKTPSPAPTSSEDGGAMSAASAALRQLFGSEVLQARLHSIRLTVHPSARTPANLHSLQTFTLETTDPLPLSP